MSIDPEDISDLCATIRWYECDRHGCGRIIRGDASHHSGAGWYVYCAEYPDEGSSYLGTEESTIREAARITECEISP